MLWSDVIIFVLWKDDSRGESGCEIEQEEGVSKTKRR